MNFSGDWANGRQNTDYADWGPSNFYYGNTGYEFKKKYNLTYSAYAQYMKDFLKTQNINVMVGYEWSHAKNWGDNLFYDPRTSTPDVAGQKYSKGIWKSENYLVSFFGRMTYSAWDRYGDCHCSSRWFFTLQGALGNIPLCSSRMEDQRGGFPQECEGNRGTQAPSWMG